MAFEENEDNEPAKLTEEMRAEITEEEPIENNVRVLQAAGPIVEPEVEERFEETTDIVTTKAQEREIERGRLGERNQKSNQDHLPSYTVSCASIPMLGKKRIWLSKILKNN
ncbi:MAG TPA: hypothetical protein VF884_00775 [Nitrososphaeraceae archaeon]